MTGNDQEQNIHSGRHKDADRVPTEHRLQTHRPLIIARAAIDSPDWRNPQVWHSSNTDGTVAKRMTRKDLQSLSSALQYNTHPDGGRTILTWNGTGFDFDHPMSDTPGTNPNTPNG